jgi:hypothetical protein
MTQDPDQPPTAPGADDPADPTYPASRPPHGLYVALMIAVACALFMIAASVLYQRWLTVREPDARIIVVADQLADPLTVRVTGVAMIRPAQTTLDEELHKAEFQLQAGSYTIVFLRGEEILDRQDLTLSPRQRATVTFTDRAGSADPISASSGR